MKTRYFYIPLAAVGLAVVVGLFFQGCAGKVPPVSAVVTQKAAPLPSNYISNFENGSIYVNSYLEGYPTGNSSSVTQVVLNGSPAGSASSFNPGYWSDSTYGGPAAAPNTINGTFVVPNTVSDSVDSSNYAIHIGWPTGPITLIAVGGYEADQLVCHLENSATNPYYDASPFVNGGIAFDYNIPASDTNTSRQFQVATINTTSAYNHFHYLLPNGSSSGWKAVTLSWSQITNPGFGPNSGPVTTTGPTTVGGTVYPGNLNHIAFLQWQFSDNVAGSAGAPVTTMTEFWVDNVQFLP